MIKQSNYEDIKRSWQVELTQSEAIINHWLHETTFPKLLPTLVRAEDQADFSLCRGDLGQKKKRKSLFLCVAPLRLQRSRRGSYPQVWGPLSGAVCRPRLSSPPAILGLHLLFKHHLKQTTKKEKKTWGGGGGEIKHWLARKHWQMFISGGRLNMKRWVEFGKLEINV